VKKQPRKFGGPTISVGHEPKVRIMELNRFKTKPERIFRKRYDEIIYDR